MREPVNNRALGAHFTAVLLGLGHRAAFQPRFGRVSAAFRTRFGRVSAVFRPRFGRVSGAFRPRFGRVSIAFRPPALRAGGANASRNVRG